MKNFIKKIQLGLIILTFMVNIGTVFASSGGSEEETNLRVEYFDLVRANLLYNKTKNLTRGEFVYELLYFLGKSEFVPVTSNTYFYDVPTEHKYANSINYMVDLGYIEPDVSGTFLPDGEISVKEAAMILMNTMGYGIEKNVRTGTITESTYSELLEGIDQSSGKLSVDSYIKLLDNSLDLDMIILSDNAASKEYVKKNFMNAYFKIYEVKGRVTATSMTSLYENVFVGENEICIDSEFYCLSNNIMNSTDYLGYQVKAYYRQNDDNENEIIYLKNYKTSEIVVKASQFISYDDNTIIYEDEDNGRRRKVSFENGSSVIYNGILITTYNPDIFNIQSGSIEVVGVGDEYDVVKIYNYTDIVVGAISDEPQIIYSKYTTDIINIEDYQDVIIRDKFGMNMCYERLKDGMVLSIGESKDKDLLILNVGEKIIEGTLEKVSEDNGFLVWTVDGTEYRFSPIAEQKQTQIGIEVTLHLNYLDRIAYAFIGKSTNLSTGYLLKGYFDDDEGLIVLKIFTEYGEYESFKCSDKVKIDGVKVSGNDILEMLSYESKDSMTPGDKTYPQLINYNLSNGRINKIDTVRVVEDDKETSLTQNVYNEERIYHKPSNRLMTTSGSSSGFGMDCLLDEGIKVFIVPQDAEEAGRENESYAISNTSYFTHDTNYYIDTYNTNYTKGGVPGIIVVRVQSLVSTLKFCPLENNIFVTKIGEALDDDTVVKFATGYNWATQNYVTIKDCADVGVLENKEIEPGDIIRYGLVNGDLTTIDVDMDYGEDLSSGYSYSEQRTNDNSHFNYVLSKYRVSVGKIIDVNGNYVYFGFDANEKTRIENARMIFDITDKTKVFVFDKNKNKNKITESSIGGLKEYTCANNNDALVAIYNSGANANLIVVYI